MLIHGKLYLDGRNNHALHFFHLSTQGNFKFAMAYFNRGMECQGSQNRTLSIRQLVHSVIPEIATRHVSNADICNLQSTRFAREGHRAFAPNMFAWMTPC